MVIVTNIGYNTGRQKANKEQHSWEFIRIYLDKESFSIHKAIN